MQELLNNGKIYKITLKTDKYKNFKIIWNVSCLIYTCSRKCILCYKSWSTSCLCSFLCNSLSKTNFINETDHLKYFFWLKKNIGSMNNRPRTKFQYPRLITIYIIYLLSDWSILWFTLPKLLSITGRGHEIYRISGK